jgi:hypothetical protein
VAAVVGVDRAARSERADAFSDTWGSLALPKFEPQHVQLVQPEPTFGSFLKTQRDRLTSRIEVLKGAESQYVELATLTDQLESAAGSAAEVSRLAAQIASIRSSIALPPFQEPLLSQAEKSEMFKAKHGDVAELTRRIFKATTGREMPATLSIELVELEADRAGEVADYSSDVKLATGEYALQLRTSLHEVGHVLYQGHEAAGASWIPFGLESALGESSLMEECAAELFRLSAMAHLDDPLLKNEVGGLDYSRIEDSLMMRPDTPHRHNAAFALADAYLELSNGDPTKAYLAMNRHASPSVEALKIVERNRADLSSGPSLDELKATARRQFEIVDERLGELERRIESLRRSKP